MAKASEMVLLSPASGRLALTLMRHIAADQASSLKFLYEAETLPVLDAVGIKDAVEVIAFVLDDARNESPAPPYRSPCRPHPVRDSGYAYSGEPGRACRARSGIPPNPNSFLPRRARFLD